MPPVRWQPAKPANFARGRHGRVPIAEINHRMVGWLLGTRRYFTLTSDRPVSTHFGIGHEARDPDGTMRPLCPVCGPITGARGPLVIDQYVDLADTAFGNGNWHPSGGWPLLARDSSGVVNPNFYTYSIEHEDGATAGKGLVTAHVRAASVELTRALHTKSLAELRELGIRIGSRDWHGADDGARIVRALHAIPIHAERFTDHHRIAGTLKPYCWQPWMRDLGYARGGTRDAKLRALRPPVTPPPMVTPNIVARYDNVRIRRSPAVTAPVAYSRDAGDMVRSNGTIVGGPYVIQGHAGRTWRRVVAIDGRRLATPLYTAEPLWRVR